MTPALCGPEFHRSKGVVPAKPGRVWTEKTGDRSRVFSAIARVSNAGAVEEPSNGGDARVDGTFQVIPVDSTFRRDQEGSSEAASDPPQDLVHRQVELC
jgi:hypothetical protein